MSKDTNKEYKPDLILAILLRNSPELNVMRERYAGSLGSEAAAARGIEDDGAYAAAASGAGDAKSEGGVQSDDWRERIKHSTQSPGHHRK